MYFSIQIHARLWHTSSKETAARNKLRTHLFLNVPPVDASPFAVTIRTGPEGLRKTIGKFNEKFAARVIKYAKDNPGNWRSAIWFWTKILTTHTIPVEQLVLTFDAASVFENILSHPHKFGFDNTSKYVFLLRMHVKEYLWNMVY
jgi:hypothetical protein